MKNCPVCKKKFIGRTDKKFCSVACKSFYHSRLKKVTVVAVQNINNILQRNRSILLEILGKHGKQAKINRIILDQKKFNFKYHTHFQVNSAGKMYLYVYECAWMEFSDDEILIVIKKEN
jgi:hypothetical protein